MFRKIPGLFPKILLHLVLFFLIYSVVGSAYFYFLRGDIQDTSQWFSKLLFSWPVFLLIYALFWLQSPSFAFNFNPPEPTRFTVSNAQRKTERKAAFIMAVIIPFMALTGIVVELHTDTPPSILPLVAPLMWIWIVRFVGLERMRFGFVQIFCAPPTKPSRDDMQEALTCVATGLALEQGIHIAKRWQALFYFTSDTLAPEIKGYILSIPEDPETDKPRRIDFSDIDCLALQVLSTKDANPYRLLHINTFNIEINLDNLSSHAKISCLKKLSDTRSHLKDFFRPEDLAQVSSTHSTC
jgi:hypothetical protein